MNRFYKVIFIGDMHSDSLFALTFGIHGLTDLKPGRKFMATHKYTSVDIEKYAIPSPVPLIHFCDNAVDTLLWRQIFGHVRYVFEIQPIGPITYDICKDHNRLQQCGAPGIELKQLVTENGLINLAKAEMAVNPDRIINQYENPLIRQWLWRLYHGARK